MNFSLRYLTEQKKNISKDLVEPNNFSAREKGSNAPYLSMFFTESVMKGKKSSRPTTTHTRANKVERKK